MKDRILSDCNHTQKIFTNLLPPWSRVLLEKTTGSQLVKKFQHIMEPEGSLLSLQVSATCLYPEPDQSSPCSPPPPPPPPPPLLYLFFSSFFIIYVCFCPYRVCFFLFVY